jgi:DNA invertase Pin-like site-specific DNA recombinase
MQAGGSINWLDPYTANQATKQHGPRSKDRWARTEVNLEVSAERCQVCAAAGCSSGTPWGGRADPAAASESGRPALHVHPPCCYCPPTNAASDRTFLFQLQCKQGKVAREVWPMKTNVRLYARVSHANGDQHPEGQLMPLRKFAAARGWKVIRTYVDRASATNERRRTAWARLMADAAPKEVVLVWRLDRAFRSVLHAARDVERLKSRGVSFVSMTEGFDLATSSGRLMFDLLVAFADFERRTISERIKSGQARARAQGLSHGGFPKGMRRAGRRGKMIALSMGRN